MKITIRPFEDADFPALAELRNANFPENPVTAETLRFQWESLDPAKFYRERHVAVDPSTGRLVATTSFSHNVEMFHSDKYECGIGVHPDYQRRGIGAQLWELLYERLRARGAILARGGVWEKYPYSVAFAERLGFREKRRSWQSILEVESVNLQEYAHRWERVREQGIVLTTLAEEQQRDPECLRKLYVLSNTLLRHTPLPDVPTDPPYEMFLRWTVENPKSIPEALFIARDGDRYVGLSHLGKSDETDALNQWFTGTDPDYMGRGIAWALKLNTVKFAQEHGYKRIKTWNDTENQRMLSINLRLGYQPQPAWITMEKDLVEPGSDER